MPYTFVVTKQCTYNNFVFYLRGDLKAIKRITLEFCEDVAKNGTIYVEPRFCPHLMLSEKIPEVTARHVVQTVLEGLQEGENLYGVKVRYLFVCVQFENLKMQSL